MKRIKELREQQKRFCEYYVQTGKITDSALKAGYSKNYATRQAGKLLENVGIKEYINSLNKKADSEKIAGIKEIQEFWTKVLVDSEEKMADRLKASELLGKSKGAFLDKVEVSGGVSIVITGEDELDE